MSGGLDDSSWDDLLGRINENEVVPVIGPGVVTFGAGDELLYSSLAQRLPAQLDPPLTFQTPPRDLQEIIDAQRAKGLPIERIYRRLNKIVEDPDLRPGPTLAALAAIEGFRLFLSTTFDPLLPRAVESASPGGKPDERQAASSLRNACPDLPQEFTELKHRFVYQILGRARPERDFVVWDDDMFRFLLRLNEQLPNLPKLKVALQERHFLVLGLSFSDWLLRFFVQVVKGQPLSELASSELFIFERLDPADREKVVIYFSRLTKKIRVHPIDPIEFIAELHSRWRKKHPAPSNDPYLLIKGHREKHRSPGCIFVSYASPDLEIARYIVSQLQKAGCMVWFDKQQLDDYTGQDWEEFLRDAVEKRCGLFLSLISGETTVRHDGYNILERNLAARRQDRFADNAVFYIPMRIDDGEPLVPENEPLSGRKIQGRRFPGGHLAAEFISQLHELQQKYCEVHGLPGPTNPD